MRAPAPASVSAAGDRQDFYRIALQGNASAGEIAQVVIDHPSGAGIRADFFRSDFTYIGTDATAYNPATGTFGGAQTRFSVAAPVNGDYYLRVVAIRDGGPYDLSVGIQRVDRDTNGNCTTAVPLVPVDSHHLATVNDSVGAGIDEIDLFT